MAKWLDKDGTSYLWGKIKSNFAFKSDAIKNITRSGTTFTATRADNTTFTFTQQDNNTNTTYTLTQDSSDGHKITLTPSSGSATTITIPDNNTVYTHPTTSGNKHIPSGGSSGQILRWSADGTAVWDSDNNTTYSANNGISLNGTVFSNSGVRSIATGSTNGTISVNTNGTAADVAVKGLGTAAYTASTTYVAKAGDTMTGALNFANNTLNKVGDDAYLGDVNQAGKIGIKGVNGASGFYFQPYSGSTAQSLSIDGAGTMSITGNYAVAGSIKTGDHVTQQYNTTTQALDFIFS